MEVMLNSSLFFKIRDATSIKFVFVCVRLPSLAQLLSEYYLSSSYVGQKSIILDSRVMIAASHKLTPNIFLFLCKIVLVFDWKYGLL